MCFSRVKSFVGLVFLTMTMSVFGETLSLDQMRTEVLSNNIDVRLQYEKYYQSQRNVSVKFGEFLPNLNFHVLYAPTTAAILQSVVPTPSDWFVYQASKELKVAEEYTSETLKLNILEGLTNTYINIKTHEKVLESLLEQTSLLEAEYDAAYAVESLGMGSQMATFQAKRALLEHNQQVYVLKVLIAAQKEALLLALGRTPTAELELAEIPVDTYEIPETIELATEMALQNSTELVANVFMQEAVNYMIKSQRYSFLSFNGIGFDYPALLSIEYSKAEVIKLQNEKIRLGIINQVNTAYKELALVNERIQLQEEQSFITESIYSSQLELFNGQQIDKSEFLASQIELMSEDRELLLLEMEKRVILNKIKRLIGVDATLMQNDEPNNTDIRLTLELRSNKKVRLSVVSTSELNNSIVSVSYAVESFSKLARTTDSLNDFAKLYKFRKRGDYQVTATILLRSGMTIKRTGLIQL